MNEVYHYPPELLQLLIEAIPLLCRGKDDVRLFFRGAGVPNPVTADLAERIKRDRASVGKHSITRTVLTRLNERGGASLRDRREVLRRVAEFEDFSTCWPDDQLKAKGLVSEIRRVVNVKDSFTRLDQERERERQERIQSRQRAEDDERAYRSALREVQQDLGRLFGEVNPQRRGKLLEGVLNRLFAIHGVLITEAFTLTGSDGEGIVEQVDGVIQLDGQHYLVEMKWWAEPLGVGDVSTHLVRIFNRGHARGIFISSSGYSAPAVATCRDALQRSVVVLAELRELVLLVERGVDLKLWLREKINAAIVEKDPHRETQALA